MALAGPLTKADVMRTTIATAALAAALAITGCSATRMDHHPQATTTTSSPADQSCQIAETAEIRAEGALSATFSTTSLRRAVTVWKLAARKITDSGVPLDGTRDGHLVADIDLAVVWADDVILALDLGKESSATEANSKLLVAEEKVTSDCGS